ncbi:hypothetical protein PUNSTDRAFT_134595 [Punctularia strigosozonata HHB-11173 SS5]|uniref:uncharacterized protein n=1 Tax=Punctularia strigosozonata (strain HHB-11173) TaxID=741275 RepID=UPI0004417D1F|nr:uncharacterized protein PUNSTDRAFT_134595 [Punctularia strigosozonata HHB-11173 SS5]EIN08204.1 hypothetical protein PUNSTDRAFT_134595 [Punctularia strigosozonata HHB-11173 SS5]
MPATTPTTNETGNMTVSVLREFSVRTDEAQKLIDTVWAIYRDSITTLLNRYTIAKQEGRLDDAIAHGQAALDIMVDWRGTAWDQAKKQIQNDIDEMKTMQIDRIVEVTDKDKTEVKTEEEGDGWTVAQKKKKGKQVPRRKDRDEVSSTRANDGHDDKPFPASESGWPASADEPMPWDTCTPLGWSPFRDEEEAKKYGATTQKVAGVTYVTYTDDAVKKLDADNWPKPEPYPSVNWDEKFPAYIHAPWEGVRPNDPEADKYWDLIATDHEGNIIDYNATRLRELQEMKNPDKKELWEKRVLRVASDQYWIRRADKAAEGNASMVKRCWLCDRYHDLGTCMRKRHPIVGAHVDSDEYVRNRVKGTIANELRKMHGKSGQNIERWRIEWAEMLNYVDQYGRA